MEIAKVRRKLGLSEASYIAKLSPLMQAKGTSITLPILKKIEAGDEISAHRLEALEECIKQAFPEYAGKALCEKNESNTVQKIFSFKLEMLLGFALLVLFVIYFSFDIMRTEFTNFAAGPLVIAGGLFAIYRVWKQKR